MKKFQHSKQANNQLIHQAGNKSSTTSTFLTSIENSDEFDQEQVEAIKTFIGGLPARGRGGRGGGRGGAAGGARGGDRKRIWKCSYCICDHPKWKDCGCPCTKHKRENCPNPDPAKMEAFRKRKAEQDDSRDTRRRQDLPPPSARNQGGTERGYIAYSRSFTDQLANAELPIYVVNSSHIPPHSTSMCRSRSSTSQGCHSC